MPIFEIHDLSRAGDIRMRRRRAAILLAAIVVVPWVLLQDNGSHVHRHVALEAPAFHFRLDPIHVSIPDGPSRSLTASDLTVDLPCASSVIVKAVPELVDRIIVSVRSGQDAALQAIDVQGGNIRESPGCSEGDGGDFILQAPPTMPLRIVQSGDLDMHVGRFTGPGTIDGSGSGDVVVEQAGSLSDQQRSAGDVSVAQVSGNVVANLTGSGDLRIGSGHAGSLVATLHGSGDLVAGSGASFDGVQAVLDNSGDLSLGTVNGHLDAQTTGSGDIGIWVASVDTAQLAGSGSGDILIRAGRIETLMAERHGSGDLTVRATVGNAQVSHTGAGDVTLPHVTGHRVVTDSEDNR